MAGVLFNNGNDWRMARCFTQKAFRHMGIGGERMVKMVEEEVGLFIKHLTTTTKKPQNFGNRKELLVNKIHFTTIKATSTILEKDFTSMYFFVIAH
jgi:hypothetical protein